MSSTVDKLTILLLRISSFVRELLRFACVRFSLFVVRFRSKVSMPICSLRVVDSVFNFCICFLKTDLGLKNIDPEVVVSYLPVVGDTSVVCRPGCTRYTRFVGYFVEFGEVCNPAVLCFPFG